MVRISQFHLAPAVALIILLIHSTLLVAVSRPHVISFGKWSTVQCSSDSAAGDKLLTLKVRPLLVDAHFKEFTLGLPHEVTDRLFVVRRAFRVNDSLPQESSAPPHWQWQRGGWLLVDRVTGRISVITLPAFDTNYSTVIWYRDYAAYCGFSDDSKQIYAVVAQISRRKPVVKWLIGETKTSVENQESRAPESDCKLPDWQRAPARVTFESNSAAKRTYLIHGHTVDLVADQRDDDRDDEKDKGDEDAPK